MHAFPNLGVGTFCMALTVSVLGSPARATTWSVPRDAQTIQGAIDLAAIGDTVVVACGTYYEHDIDLRPGINLRSETREPDCVVIDAQSLGRVMKTIGYYSTVNYLIEGITFTGGLAGGQPPNRWGGGLYCVSARPLIRNCNFSGNSALPWGQGGGFFAQGPYSSPTLFDCIIRGNSADYGGGARAYDGCEAEFVRCVIDSNYAQSEGGGVYSNFGFSSPTFRECQIVDNHGYQRGGGIYAEGITLERCLVARNRTSHPSMSYGGGLWCDLDDSTSVLHNRR